MLDIEKTSTTKMDGENSPEINPDGAAAFNALIMRALLLGKNQWSSCAKCELTRNTDQLSEPVD
jgi:hypothetical protein